LAAGERHSYAACRNEENPRGNRGDDYGKRTTRMDDTGVAMGDGDVVGVLGVDGGDLCEEFPGCRHGGDGEFAPVGGGNGSREFAVRVFHGV
jgi:hypothetical protein